jgi:hypothetical protein
MIRILSTLGGTVYSVTLDKSRMHHPMTLVQTMPLQLQALVEHFHVECTHFGETGMVVADWSSQHADQHASRCVASFVASRRLQIHPGVYYASSSATLAIQAADLIAGACRRIAEGDAGLGDLDMALTATRALPHGFVASTIHGRQYEHRIRLF